MDSIKTKLRLGILKQKSHTVLHRYRNDGFQGVLSYLQKGVKKRFTNYAKRNHRIAADILMVSIDEPLLDRYRTDHMIEQFKSTETTVDKIYYYELTQDHARRYNTFIFYRCPWREEFDGFFKEAKKRNKTLIYTVDDLVIDTKYTNNLPVIKEMNDQDKKLYDSGVNGHKKVMEHCEYAIVTTTQLAKEIKKYKNIKDVFINKNTMSEEMIFCSNKAIEKVKKENEKVIIGYFSGTATHNEDFKIVAPALVEILNKYDNTYVKLTGRVDAPDQLKTHEDRIIYAPYVDWRKLPFELRECDITLAPLVDTIFNRAKSEIKWAESSLVGVPVVASDVGAFKENIPDGAGLLVNNTPESWFWAIDSLVENEKLRKKIGAKSREFVLENYKTIGKNAIDMKNFIKSISPKVIGFASVSFAAASGGNVVIKKHMDILREAGYIVYGIETMEYKENDKWRNLNRDDDKKYDIFRINSTRKADRIALGISFDRLIATFWPSVDFVDSYQHMNKEAEKLYLVQGMEANFYAETDEARVKAMATYSNPRLRPVTISKWCQAWLKSDFGRIAKYAPNGIDIDKYEYRKRNFLGQKIRVLVEGDSDSEYKNVDESFIITNNLDREKYEVSYLSNNTRPKDWYLLDSVYLGVPSAEVGKIYEKHDILVKSSMLESFSLPPLEMMAVGGVSVLVKNDGNSEYIQDELNALYYEQGNIEDALAKIEKIVLDSKKYKLIAENGRKTAESRDWGLLNKSILELYE